MYLSAEKARGFLSMPSNSKSLENKADYEGAIVELLMNTRLTWFVSQAI